MINDMPAKGGSAFGGRILLVGGGTAGPVAPLLAVAENIKQKHPLSKFLLVGGKNGPERHMAESAGIDFANITAGKLRRYFSFKNFFIPFLTLVGFFQSLKILKEFKPDCVFGTGSFLQVPLVWAAWFLKIPVVLHQQDIIPSLANRLSELAATKITATFKINMKDFSSTLGIFYKKNQDKVILTGNPFREALRQGDKIRAQTEFNLKADLPTLLVIGGGTGAAFINQLIKDTLSELAKTVQIIHSTGKGKQLLPSSENYHAFEFIENMADAYVAADIVVARAGLSTLTELSNLKKVSIIIPMPETHQELNGLFLSEAQGAIVLRQQKITGPGFVRLIRKLLFEHDLQKNLKESIGLIMPHNSSEKIAEIIVKLALKNG